MARSTQYTLTKENADGSSKAVHHHAQQIKALGDGNCAFNAFALSLFHLHRTGQLTVLHYDLLDAALGLLEDNFPKLKSIQSPQEKLNYFLEQVRDHHQRQRYFAKALRQLAIQQLAQENRLAENLLSMVQNDFRNYCMQRLFPARQSQFRRDDLFADILAFSTQYSVLFNALKRELDEQAPNYRPTEDELEPYFNGQLPVLLSEWFDQSGGPAYLNHMSRPFVNAGAVELAALAEQFHLNLTIVRQGAGNRMVISEGSQATVLLVNNYAHWDFLQAEPEPNHQKRSREAFFSKAPSQPQRGTKNGTTNARPPQRVTRERVTGSSTHGRLHSRRRTARDGVQSHGYQPNKNWTEKQRRAQAPKSVLFQSPTQPKPSSFNKRFRLLPNEYQKMTALVENHSEARERFDHLLAEKLHRLYQANPLKRFTRAISLKNQEADLLKQAHYQTMLELYQDFHANYMQSNTRQRFKPG